MELDQPCLDHCQSSYLTVLTAIQVGLSYFSEVPILKFVRYVSSITTSLYRSKVLLPIDSIIMSKIRLLSSVLHRHSLQRP